MVSGNQHFSHYKGPVFTEPDEFNVYFETKSETDQYTLDYLKSEGVQRGGYRNKIMKDKSFYKTEDLAELLELNIMTIYRYIKAGRLKAYKLGRDFG